MSNAWHYYLFPLGIAIVFVTGPLLSLRNKIRSDKPARDSLGRSASREWTDGAFELGGTILFVGVGLTLGLGILLTSPTPWQRQRLFDHIFRTPPERIERFVILPGKADQYQPITSKKLVIDDPARIRRIAEILKSSREVSPNHPRAKWSADVEMVTQDGTYYFGITATVPGDTNGTLVSARSRIDDGRWQWNLGGVRADGLDQVLEEVVAEAKLK